MLADINGHTLGLLDAVRGGEGLAGEIDPDTPMIVLTSRADELARVRVFDRGGDDVVANRSPTRSCADGSARSCAEHTSGRPRASAASGR